MTSQFSVTEESNQSMTHYVIEVEKETRRSRNVNKSRKIKRLKVAPSHHM